MPKGANAGFSDQANYTRFVTCNGTDSDEPLRTLTFELFLDASGQSSNGVVALASSGPIGQPGKWLSSSTVTRVKTANSITYTASYSQEKLSITLTELNAQGLWDVQKTVEGKRFQDPRSSPISLKCKTDYALLDYEINAIHAGR